MFELGLLGGASLRNSTGRLVAGPAVQRHRLALLAFLSLRGDRPARRDTLLAALWPERDTGAARRLLNLSVHTLRQVIGRDAIRTLADGLVLDPGLVTSDVARFEAALDRRDWDQAFATYHGPFLEGFHLPGSPEFDRWLDATRSRLAGRHASLLEARAKECEDEGDWRGAAEWWRRLVRLDQGNGSQVRRLMLALEAMRDPARALEEARLHAEYMSESAGTGPDPLVSALARALASGASTRSQDLAERQDIRPVAVLPFASAGLGAEHEGFGDGLAFEVSHRLRLAGVRVAETARQVWSADLSIAEIGARLGVSLLLQGSVRRIGCRLRIQATLVDARTSMRLWSGRFDRATGDPFELQEEVGAGIAEQVEPELDARRRSLTA